MKLSDIRAKAVLTGIAVDAIGSVCVGVLLGIAIGVAATVQGNPTREHIIALKNYPPIALVGLFGTILSTVLGSYLAARMSRPYGSSNALAVGITSTMLAIVIALKNPGIAPFWKLSLGLVLTIPAAWLGGRIDKERGR